MLDPISIDVASDGSLGRSISYRLVGKNVIFGKKNMFVGPIKKVKLELHMIEGKSFQHCQHNSPSAINMQSHMAAKLNHS